jgi:hypothetical protein
MWMAKAQCGDEHNMMWQQHDDQSWTKGNHQVFSHRLGAAATAETARNVLLKQRQTLLNA